MEERKPFDRELFLELCKKYNVPFSKEYKTPMLKLDNGELVELTPELFKKTLLGDRYEE